MNKILKSSVNPEKISLTLKGLVGVIIFGLGFLGITGITSGDLNSLIDQIVVAITQIGMAISAILTVYGGIRKIINLAKKTTQ